MPGSEEFVQTAVHALEAGAPSIWIKRCFVGVVIVAMAVYYLYQFRGLSTSQGMDQAQIGRAIASGHGWRTNFARPRAVAQLRAHRKDATKKVWFDTYNAPLPPFVDAIALLPIKSHWKMTQRDLIYAGDKAVAAMSIFLFVLSVLLLFFIARRLFDQRLALLACGLVLLCDAFWQYSLSGLPQTLLLLLFNATLYALVRAVEAQYRGEIAGIWLVAVGAGFGLLALTHALTLWIFATALVFCIFFFRPRARTAVIVLSAFAIIYLPWLIRTYLICGNPAGVAFYSLFDGIGHNEAGWMRRMELGLPGGPAAFWTKITTNLIAQSGRIFEYFGFSVVAVMFFAGLLHTFKRSEIALVRWMILAMWGGAVAGMAVYGMNEEQGVAANQLHLIFIPIMTCYGLAYLLVQWNRLGITLHLARIGFIALLYLLCALPMIFATPWFASKKTLIRWPPYVPPAIAVLNDWMKPTEVTASDMPWAIAWYADRPSLWVPDTVKTFTDFTDYNLVGAPVNGLYLTPISGTGNTYRDIVKGEYRDWASVIQRTVVLETFPLKWATVDVGPDKECVFFSDHDRNVPANP
ncbi:MAG TPA: glycosyltransferase family 39 protein [Chthoniobacterales bacterium]|nr:glycosyltransferase family 39 protein [Chthoniobacterales bacterium]